MKRSQFGKDIRKLRMRWDFRIIVVLLPFLLAACGNQGDRNTFNPTDPTLSTSAEVSTSFEGSGEFSQVFSRPANPLNVHLALADASVVQVIGPKGGVIEVSIPDGRTHRVTFEPDTFLVDTEVTATGILGAEGMPEGVMIETGLQLEPHGTALGRPAMVSLELPSNTDTEDYIAFSTLANGEQVYPTIGSVNGGRLEIPIITFSTYDGGNTLAELEQVLREEHPVTSPGRRALAELASVLRELSNSQQAGETTEGLNDPRIVALLDSWWTQGIEPLANQALSDDVAMMKLAFEAALLQAVAQLLDATEFSNLLSDVMSQPLLNAYDRSLIRCKKEHRLGEYRYLLNLVGEMQLHGVSDDDNDVFSDIVDCARFRLTLESTITQDGKSEATSNTQTLFLQGEIKDLGIVVLEQLYDPSETGTAGGVLDYITAEGRSVLQGYQGECVVETKSGEGSYFEAMLQTVQQRPQKYGPWSVPEIYGKVEPPPDPEPGLTIVAFDPGDPREVIAGDCLGEKTSDTTDLWDQIFWFRHNSELLPQDVWSIFFGGGGELDLEPMRPEETGFQFNLTLEDPPGRVYATYNIPEDKICDKFTDNVGGSGENCERTVLTLYHDPKE